ncbi:MAG: epoxide hydrolase family protein [Actinomycetota bacterium]
MTVAPYTIAVPDDVLADLHDRLARTRWPDPETVDDWSQGVPLNWLQGVCDYWQHHYDWRKREAALNLLDQFIAPIDGIDLHFVHQRSPHADATPLLLSHGWPGSFVEFHHVIEPLTNPTLHGGSPDDAFHVIAPSLPGYGFSSKPATPGWTVERIADAFAALMARLGYDRYLAQGGDWGAAITHAIGARDPVHCAGIHTTLTSTAPPADVGEPSATAVRAIERGIRHGRLDSGYAKQQRTRPQTLGYGLNDSPVGQAAWILEKFWSWTDHPGDPLDVLDRDDLLDNITIYWVTATATSSARLYWESYGKGERQRVAVPAGFTVYPEEIVPPVREWVEPDFANICYWNEQPRGGHFAALEVPGLFVTDVRAFAAALR